MTNNILISLIIANYNGEKYLSTCLSSVFKTKFKNFELLIIDDGSIDKSIKTITSFQKKTNRINLIRNSKNLGAAASRNKAIKKAKGEILVFLDNDTGVTENWLGELIKPLLREKNIGATQALLLDFERRDQIQMAGGLLIPHTGWLIPFYQWESYQKIKDMIKEREIIGISAALAVKKEVIDTIGGFDEKEAQYTEDLDFCWRIWIAGYSIVLAPKSIVYHWTKSVEQRANMKASYKQIYFHLAKNSFRSIIKNYEFKNVLFYLPTSIVTNFFRAFLVLVRDKSLSALRATLRAIYWTIKNLEDALEERAAIQKARKVKDTYIMKRVFISENIFGIYNKYFRQRI